MPPHFLLGGLVLVLGIVSVAERRRRAASDAGPSTPRLTADQYFAERALLIQARQGAYQRTDQIILGGAAGALVLSVTFLEKLVPQPTVVFPLFLVFAWGALLLGLLAALAGQFVSGRSFDRELDGLDADVHGKPRPRNKWAPYTRLCLVLSALLLVVGITLLALFAYFNAPFSR